jgi:hypothetical protein
MESKRRGTLSATSARRIYRVGRTGGRFPTPTQPSHQNAMEVPHVTGPNAATTASDETRSRGGPPGGRERRRNPHLRELIDEMLATVRVTLRQELISDAERVDAERQLEMIMSRVRAETVRRPMPE